jgi:hypothetical protein
LLPGALVCGCSSSSRQVEVRRWALTGQTFRAVVETAVSTTGPLDHMSHLTDPPQTYLLVVDLARPQGDRGRARVYGPLWRASESAWSVEADEPDPFVEDETRLGAPDYAFDADGTLVCFLPDRGGTTVRRRRLVSDETGAHWEGPAHRQPRPPFTRGIVDQRARSNDLRYHLTRVDGGGSALIDRVQGRAVPDPWLERALDQEIAIPDFQNVRLLLSDDRNYLVALPAPVWNVNARPGGRFVRTFDLDGRSYSRGRHGIAWARPAEKPAVFERLDDADYPGWPGPAAVYSIAGELFFHYCESAQQRLVSLDGRTTYATPPEAAGRWGDTSNARLVGQSTVVVMDSVPPTDREDAQARLVTWDFRTGQVRRYDLPIEAWFGRKRLRKEGVGEQRL